MEKVTIFHIDVNSAFLSWTAVDLLNKGGDVDLRQIPAIIGGEQASRHGVVLAKSIPTKKYGIQTGEPVLNAFKKCPFLVMEPPNSGLYARRSEELMSLLYEFTPDIEQMSVDECFLDYTGIAHLYKNPVECAGIIKGRVEKELGFTVNIGISNVKLLAKMASDFQKPNQIHTLYLEEIRQKMWPLPVGDLYMAGKSSVATLQKLGIYTIGDLAKTDPVVLEMHLKSQGRRLWENANGLDDSKVINESREVKGIGNSTTVAEDIIDVEEAFKVLLRLAESVGRRLRRAEKKAFMVSVEIKYSTFISVSHQKQLTTPTQSTKALYEEAMSLFENLWNKEPIRLLGIRTSKLVDEDEPEQMNLFSMDWEGELNQDKKDNTKDYLAKREKLEKAIDGIRNRFGKDSVQRGSLLDGGDNQKSK